LFGSEENKWREKKWIVMWWWMRIKEVDDEWNGMEKNGIWDDGLYLSATCVFFFFIVQRFFFFLSILCVCVVWIIEVAVFIAIGSWAILFYFILFFSCYVDFYFLRLTRLSNLVWVSWLSGLMMKYNRME
jgi:hypothetical protein